MILILGVATFSILYFATDIFKSTENNKEMFYKYASQINLNSFLNKEFYGEYSNKLKTNKYKEDTKIIIEYENDDLLEKIDKEINIVSKRDIQKNLFSSEITVSDGETTEFSLNYLKNEDIYGILLKDIINQYIAVENSNLKDLASKLGMENVIQIPDKIEFSQEMKSEISTEEIAEFINRYKGVLLNSIPDDCYSKIEKEQIEVENNKIEADGYKVTINVEQLKQIMTTLVQELMNDQQVYNAFYEKTNQQELTMEEKLNQQAATMEEYIEGIESILESTNEVEVTEENKTMEEYKEGIESILEFINEIEVTEENKNIDLINVLIYKNGNETKKVYIKIGIPTTYVEMSMETNKPKMIITLMQENNRILDIELNKSINEPEQEKLDISVALQVEENPFNMNMLIQRIGTSNSQKVETIIKATFENEELGNGRFEIIDNVEFDDSIEIEKFDESNHLVINELSEEQINNLITNLGRIVSEKVEDETTYIYIALGLPFAIIEGNIYEKGIVTGLVGVGVTINVSMKGPLFKASSETARIETKKAMVTEAVALTKSQILSYYYSNNTTEDITEENIKKIIESYLNEDYNIEVVKLEELQFTILVEGIDEEFKLDLTTLPQRKDRFLNYY